MLDKKSAVIIIKNSSGQIFIHQRSNDKDLFPSLYGLGAGGKFGIGEIPEQAAKRELKEELGIEGSLKFLFNFDFESPEVTHTIFVFEMIYNNAIEIREKHKIQWSGWSNLDDADKLLENKKLCPDTAILYKKWKDEYLK